MIDFEEKSHTYSRNGTRYISVTQLIDRYTKPFDGEYWSLYKAVKDVLEEADLFYGYKHDAGGWKNVVAYFKKWGAYTEQLNYKIVMRQNWYLEKWDLKRDAACEKGSKIHKELEDAVNNARVVAVEALHLPVDRSSYMPLGDFESSGIWTEPYIWSDRYQVAGRSDVVIKIGRRIRIKDYKTNEKITTEPFDKQCLLPPLDHVPDTKYHKYCLQLSTYGLLLEDWGFRVEDLELIHITEEDGQPVDKPMKLHYLKQEAREMLENHKSQILIS